MEAFDTYLTQVKEITGEGSENFYQDVRREFEAEIFKTSPKKVRGIVVGVITTATTTREENLYLSTGNKETCDTSDMKIEMLEKLASLQDNNDIVFLRTPMISVRHNQKVKRELIDAFTQVLFSILNIILQKSADEFGSPIPILCLGWNSFTCVTNCLRQVSRSKFVILSSVHPNYMRELDLKIKMSNYRSEQLRLIRRKYYMIDMFSQVFNLFYNLSK